MIDDMEKRNGCKSFACLLDRYMDGELSESEKRFMFEHAETCEDCAIELKVTEGMIEAMRGVDDDISVPLPAQRAWRNAVRREAGKRRAGRAIKALTGIAACAAVMVGVTFGMRGANLLPARNAAPANEALTVRAAETDGAAFGMVRGLSAPEGLVIEADGSPLSDTVIASEDAAVYDDEVSQLKSAVYQADSDDFDNDIVRIRELSEEYDGYVQQELVTAANYARTAEMVCRVPAEYLDEYLTALGNIGRTVSTERFSEDVSPYYFDVQARLATKRETANRLNELIGQASGEELQKLNLQLEQVYFEIDSLTTEVNFKQNELTYAKVTVALRELNTATVSEEKSLSERSASGFRQSMNALIHFFEDMVVSLAVIAPVLILAAVGVIACGIVIYAVRRSIRKKKEDEIE